MRILIIANLFPNRKEPNRGGWNCRQFEELAKHHTIQVVAPIAWFPLVNRAKRMGIPRRDKLQGLDVCYPRYFYTPKIGRSLYGFWFFISMLIPIITVYRSFRPEIILATWAYPDGFAASLLGVFLRKPVIIKVHGTDINEYARKFLLRKFILFALRRTACVIAVSRALKKRLIEIGIPAARIAVIYNGIDTSLFFPMDREAARTNLGLPACAKIILFVGNLVAVKGIEYLLEAFRQVAPQISDDLLLILMGDGPLRESLIRKAEKLKIEKNVAFIGQRPHAEIPVWMGAGDLLCLPSLNEGVPNVILEALACGRPVVASNVGGVPEVLCNPALGYLVEPGNVSELARALKEMLSKQWDPMRIRAETPISSWEESGASLLKLLRGCLGESRC